MKAPRLAEALLGVFVADTDLEDAILGDLREEWNERVERDGVPAARAWYWGQVLRSAPHLLYERWIHPSPEKTMKPDRDLFRLTLRPLLVTAVLLMVPLVAMQFSAEMNWTPFDFVFMGVLIAGTGILFELTLTKADTTAYRAGAGLALAAAFLLVWVNAAVGIIGTSAHGANLMYAGVLAAGVSGAFAARFRARGMARAMVATALAQGAVGAVALVAGLGSAVHVVGLTGLFAALWLGSAWLFRRAARTRPTPGRAEAAA